MAQYLVKDRDNFAFTFKFWHIPFQNRLYLLKC